MPLRNAKLIASGLSLLCLPLRATPTVRVTVQRVPNGGIQPEVARDDKGVVHLLYFAGEPGHGDLFYARWADGDATFCTPLRVNSEPGTAVAIGSIRGGRIAVGRAGLVHVAWNGPGPQAPMLYARMKADGSGFEPQRNLLGRTSTLDGGGAVAADREGNVYVAWHARPEGAPADEASRTVWVARSADDGRTFAAEQRAWDTPTGACGCCGLALLADRLGTVYALYRSATDLVNRDVYVLASRDQGHTFRGSLLHGWRVSSCPLTSMAIADGRTAVVGAWETDGNVSFAALDAAGKPASASMAPPGEPSRRKHPRLAQSDDGDTLLVWTEGTAWARGGSLVWRLFGADGRPLSVEGSRPGVPVWSFGAVVTRPDGGFTVFY
jgi:hypothetical protein